MTYCEPLPVLLQPLGVDAELRAVSPVLDAAVLDLVDAGPQPAVGHVKPQVVVRVPLMGDPRALLDRGLLKADVLLGGVLHVPVEVVTQPVRSRVLRLALQPREQRLKENIGNISILIRKVARMFSPQ